LFLNQWTAQESKWLSDEQWMSCNLSPVDVETFRGKECYVGLDLASVRDVTALVFIFPNNDRLDVLPFFFMPKENAYIRSRRDGVDYLKWGEDPTTGMILTDGDVTDYDFLKEKIKELAEIFVIKSIAYDRWNASQTVIDLVAEGLPMSPFGQGFISMSAPTKQLETWILTKGINHGGNEVLRWMASNVQVQTDATENIKPSKKKSKEKIDGIVALVMAIGRYMNPGDDDSASKYESNNITFI